MRNAIIVLFIISASLGAYGAQDQSVELEDKIKSGNYEELRQLLIDNTTLLSGQKGTEFLIIAIREQNTDLVKLLLEYGADPLPENGSGKEHSPHEIARLIGNLEIIELIEKKLNEKVKPIVYLKDDSDFIFNAHNIELYDEDGAYWGKYNFRYRNKKGEFVYTDDTFYPFSYKAEEKIVLKYLDAIGSTVGNWLMSGLWGSSLGLGTLITIPTMVLYPLSAYYYPADFFVNQGKYWGTIGTVFLAIGSTAFIMGIVGFITILGSNVYKEHYKNKLLKQLNEGFEVGKKKKMRISFQF